MLRPLVVAREQGERLRFEDGNLRVVAGEGTNGIQRGEPRQGDECDLVFLGTAEDVGPVEAVDGMTETARPGGSVRTHRRSRSRSIRATAG